MAENRRAARAAARRFAGVAVALCLLTALAPVAGAQTSTKDELEAAKAEYEHLKDQIAARYDQLDRLGAEAALLAFKVEQARARFEQITEELREIRAALAEARAEYSDLRAQLDARAREAYINGPGNSLEFLLGATTLADLSDRLEYVEALTQTDADLANEVQNLKNDLNAQEHDQERLQARAAEALKDVQAQQAALDAKLAEQQAVVDDLESKIARAKELVADLTKQYQRELAALAGVKFYNGIFRVCPVDPPRAVYDGFGAPRYSGGYHPHAGNDIIAPQGTPIRAVFDGYAKAGSNGLGGYAVYVYGSSGYVYNAHLMQPGVTGSVSAGDIIGYVGETGDTNTPHDHFEWHPNVIPSNWPASAYGYDVIGTAVNPYPLLQQVC